MAPPARRKSTSSATHPYRHTTSLTEDIAGEGLLRNKSSKKRKSISDGDAANGTPGYVDAPASRKILKIGRELQEEDATEAAEAQARIEKHTALWEPSSRAGGGAEDEDEDPAKKWEDDEGAEGEWGSDEEIVEEEVDPHDLDLFNRFLPPQGDAPTLDLNQPAVEEQKGTNLADLILKEIAAHEARQAGADGEATMEEDDAEEEIPAKVVEVYSKVGMMLARYKSGKLPKPFNILPTLSQWEPLLEITQPDEWTPNAVLAATKIFVTAKPAVVQRFLETAVLERVRSEIYETKKLHVHLFEALKRATYKPAGFFKGFLFPLVQSGTCTLREAHVVSGVLARCSIPVLHSAAALLRLTDIAAEQASVSTESGGATNIFIRVLLEKKYALPYKVVDNLVFHFLRFRAFDPGSDAGAMDTAAEGRDGRDWKLPVLWHRCLLAFAQRYRNDITEDQREALLDLLLVRWHKEIGPEVRRELLAGRGRGIPAPLEAEGVEDGDDTMVVDV